MPPLMTSEQKAAGLDAAVTSAAEALESGLTEQEIKNDPDNESSAGEEDQISEETDQTDDNQASDELDDDAKDEALRLYKALKDPKIGPAIIAALAVEAGLDVKGKGSTSETPTKAEEKKATKAIKDVLSEALGKEFEFLVPKLGPVFEEVMSQLKAENQQTVSQIQLKQIQDDTKSVMADLNRQTKGASAKLEGRMAELADELPIGPKMSIEKYINHLYTIAAAEKGIKVESGATNTNRVRANANNAQERVHGSTGRGAQTTKSVIGKTKMSLNESVKAAYAELAKGK